MLRVRDGDQERLSVASGAIGPSPVTSFAAAPPAGDWTPAIWVQVAVSGVSDPLAPVAETTSRNGPSATTAPLASLPFHAKPVAPLASAPSVSL